MFKRSVCGWIVDVRRSHGEGTGTSACLKQSLKTRLESMQEGWAIEKVAGIFVYACLFGELPQQNALAVGQSGSDIVFARD